MKKGSEWFKLLSEKEQQEFKENCDDFNEAIKNECSFLTFIAGYFTWEDSPQGWDYWNKISEKL